MATKRGDGGEGKPERRRKGANGDGGATVSAGGVYQYRMTLPDGRRLSARAKTYEEAKRRCKEKAALAEQGVDLKATRQTLGAYLAWWLDDVVAGRAAPKTTRTYRDLLAAHVLPDLGKVEVGRLSAQQVQALLRKKEREGLSPRTVAHIRGTLRTALNHAVRVGAVSRNVVLLTDPPRQSPVEQAALSLPEARQLLGRVDAERSAAPAARARLRAEGDALAAGERAALAAAADGDRLAALWRLAVTLGLRRGEVLGLRWEDVDLDAGEVRVRRNLQRVPVADVRPGHVVVGGGRKGPSVLVLRELKTARSRRTLSLPPDAVAALRAHRARQAEERLAARRWADHDLLFTTPHGTGIDPDNLYRMFKALLGRAGVRDVRFHDLRHTAASLMLAGGLPVNVVSEVLLHAQTSTTLNTYAHALPGAHRQVADAMQRLLG